MLDKISNLDWEQGHQIIFSEHSFIGMVFQRVFDWVIKLAGKSLVSEELTYVLMQHEAKDDKNMAAAKSSIQIRSHGFTCFHTGSGGTPDRLNSERSRSTEAKLEFHGIPVSAEKPCTYKDR